MDVREKEGDARENEGEAQPPARENEGEDASRDVLMPLLRARCCVMASLLKPVLLSHPGPL